MGVQRRGRAALLVGCCLALVILAGCSEEEDQPVVQRRLADDRVTVGSFDFPESVVLAELYSQVLEGAGLEVDRSFRLGPRELVAPALAQGLVEVVPEYLGTMRQFLEIGSAGDRLEALSPAPAQDANAIVVTRATARRLGLRTISDLEGKATSLSFGGPAECPSRPLCLAGLADTYDVEFAEFVRLDTGGPVTRQALRDGAVDAALLFSSDPALARGGDLVELIDDKDMQPQESVTPLVHRQALERFDPLADALNELSGHLTTDDLRALNASAASSDASVQAIAATWLEEEGLA